MAQHRVRDTFTPWWRPVLWYVLMTVGVALANTYVPGLLGRPFLVELRSAAILAVVVVALSTITFALLDRRDQRKEARRNN